MNFEKISEMSVKYSKRGLRYTIVDVHIFDIQCSDFTSIFCPYGSNTVVNSIDTFGTELLLSKLELKISLNTYVYNVIKAYKVSREQYQKQLFGSIV